MNAREDLFVTTLINWSRTIDRPMPWKGIDNPYFIWLSEIIMQQTRVEQGKSYYEKFVYEYPTIEKLAAAPLDEILKNWEGLGYYSRARNLHETAKFIVFNYKGQFPSNYEAILALKGVGNYTAAAIASFAYGMPYAVVDGNVIRVLARFFGIDEAFDTSAGKKVFEKLAQKILPTNESAIYNQAIMDFGALVCKPALALCETCALQHKCFAFQKDLVSVLPYRAKKTKVENRYFTYLVFQYKNCFYIRKREKDFWKDLHEFYLLEDNKLWTKSQVSHFLKQEKLDFIAISKAEDDSQKLSHRSIYARFYQVQLTKKPKLTDFIEVDPSKMTKFAFPKIINLYIEKNF